MARRFRGFGASLPLATLMAPATRIAVDSTRSVTSDGSAGQVIQAPTGSGGTPISIAPPPTKTVIVMQQPLAPSGIQASARENSAGTIQLGPSLNVPPVEYSRVTTPPLTPVRANDPSVAPLPLPTTIAPPPIIPTAPAPRPVNIVPSTPETATRIMNQVDPALAATLQRYGAGLEVQQSQLGQVLTALSELGARLGALERVVADQRAATVDAKNSAQSASLEARTLAANIGGNFAAVDAQMTALGEAFGELTRGVVEGFAPKRTTVAGATRPPAIATRRSAGPDPLSTVQDTPRAAAESAQVKAALQGLMSLGRRR